MITLYELHWSHYCEKVRLALRYTGLDWTAVSIDAFRKTELRGRPLPEYLPNATVPAIHDSLTGAFVMDSTPILRYLAHAYPNAPALFPGSPTERAAIDSKLLEFDGQLALPARRFAYTQVILECPDLLPELFLRHRANGFFCRPGVRRITRAVVGMLLTKRFDLHLSETLGMYEALEQYLLDLAAGLEKRPFVVGESLSAADLALAAQLRPLTIVPFFSEHPRLQSLFERHREVVGRWASGGDFAYQRAVTAARQRRAPMRRGLRSVTASLPFARRGDVAANDQRPVWTWAIATMPYHYLRSLRQNKMRKAHASSTAR